MQDTIYDSKAGKTAGASKGRKLCASRRRGHKEREGLLCIVHIFAVYVGCERQCRQRQDNTEKFNGFAYLSLSPVDDVQSELINYVYALS